MKIGDKVLAKYIIDNNGNKLQGIVVSMVDKSINPYNVVVEFDGTAIPKNTWSRFPCGNFREELLEIIE